MSENKSQKIVVLATGGTIAGIAPDVRQPQQYQAGVVPVADLLQAAEGAPASSCVSEQLAQIDSKDMGHALWKTLAQRCAHWLSQPDVRGLVITHGTDTLEETAYFLQAVLKPVKPVAMTCAMLPANAPDSDGPGNLRDALAWVAQAPSAGVVVVCAGQAHAASAVQKIYTDRCAAFDSGPAGAHACIEQGVWALNEAHRPLADVTWPVPAVNALPDASLWPQVDLVYSHAGANGRLVRAVAAPQGWVIAATGHGTVHEDLCQALLEAQSRGGTVVRASRCAWGQAATSADDLFESAGALSPVKARIALLLRLLSSF